MSKFSLAITAFEETKDEVRILDCIRPAQKHYAIDEIVIVDDHSSDFAVLETLLESEPKVKLSYNQKNLGVFGNKLEAVAQCKNDWVINCDSDNLMDEEYLDLITEHPLSEATWYCPSFAKPEFDYRSLIGAYVLEDMPWFMTQALSGCALNTGNQTVHRESYLDVFGRYRGKRADIMMPNWLNLPDNDRKQHHWRLVFDANDSFIFNMEWLTAGHSLCFLEGLEYEHYYTGGDESNYARAPVQKHDLNDCLVKEMQARVNA